MDTLGVQVVGSIATALTCTSLIPQIIRALRTRSVQDLSWGMLVTYGVGIVMWLFYSLLRLDPILIVANTVTLANVAVLTWLKHAYRAGKAAELLQAAQREGEAALPLENAQWPMADAQSHQEPVLEPAFTTLPPTKGETA